MPSETISAPPTETLVLEPTAETITFDQVEDIGDVAVDAMFDRQDPARLINEEFASLSSRPEAQSGEDPRILVEAHKNEIEELLQIPEIWEYKKRGPLLHELEGLLSLAHKSHEALVISDDEVLEITNLGVSILEKYLSKDDKEKHFFYLPSGIPGFEGIASPLTALIELKEAIKPGDIEESSSETKVLLQLQGEHRQPVHKKFLDKHIRELLAARPESEAGKLLAMPEFLGLVSTRLSENIEKYGKAKQWPEEERALFDRSLKELGFSDEKEQVDLKTAWGSYHDKEVSRQFLDKNFFAMSALLTAGKEVPHEVYSKFGIRHFGRYRPEDLFAQLGFFKGNDSKEYKNRSTTLVITAISDWNGALTTPQESYGALRPVYAEAGSLFDVARAILLTKKHLGPITSLVIKGHGAEDRIRLGSEHLIDQDQIIHSEALAKIRSKDIFTPNAEVILDACSVAANGGIAEKISKISGLDILAPTGPTAGYIEKVGTDQYKVIFPKMSDNPSMKPGLLDRLNFGRQKRVGVKFEAGKPTKLSKVNLDD